MRYGSVCSGVEAATVAWHPLGWEPQWFAEIEKFPSAVLAHHYPTVPNLGDMTKLMENQTFDERPIDLLVGGTPCQSFSVAGLRKGLSDPRGNLALVYLALAARKRPRWIVWENVPGVLSSNGGRDFGAFLGGLAELGYGFCYRVLDAQYFGVAQRRRRVFVVGYLGDWRPAAAVLFEPHGMQGHPAPRRQEGEGITPILEVGARTNGDGNRDGDGIGEPGDPMYTLQASKMHGVAPTLSARTKGGGGLGTDFEVDGGLVPSHAPRISHCLNAGGMGRQDYETETLIAAWDPRNITSKANRTRVGPGPSNTLHAGGMSIIGQGVRRLTPRECERLQGFRDDYTLIPYRGKPAADGPRYKAMGNSMAVPVMAWIGERINNYEKENAA